MTVAEGGSSTCPADLQRRCGCLGVGYRTTRRKGSARSVRNFLAVKLRLAPLAAMVASVVSAVVPAAADRMPGVDAPEALAAATALGNTYVGWNVHIPQPGYFQVSTFGASGTAPPCCSSVWTTHGSFRLSAADRWP